MTEKKDTGLRLNCPGFSDDVSTQIVRKFNA